MSTQQHQDEISHQLKSAIYLHVAKIVEDKVQSLSTIEQGHITATPAFISSLVELVYNQFH